MKKLNYLIKQFTYISKYILNMYIHNMHTSLMYISNEMKTFGFMFKNTFTSSMYFRFFAYMCVVYVQQKHDRTDCCILSPHHVSHQPTASE